jgi:hypothetical protein
MDSFQAAAWNANEGFEPFVTGGSWKKSPVTTSCQRGGENGQRGNSRRGEANGQRSHLDPPERFLGRFRADLLPKLVRDVRELVEQLTVDHRYYAVAKKVLVSSLARVVPLQSERRSAPSSMTRTLTRCHLVLAVLFLMTLLTS